MYLVHVILKSSKENQFNSWVSLYTHVHVIKYC